MIGSKEGFMFIALTCCTAFIRRASAGIGWRALCARASCLSLLAGLAVPAVAQQMSPESDVTAIVESNAVGFLNDLSARRRTTRMFPNPQSAFAGVQENFVNTSTGALTFLNRDLVRVGGMPIVMGRVYDSTLNGGGDFGPGWKLTVVEDIRRSGEQLIYRAATNATYLLDISGETVSAASPAVAPVVSGTMRVSDGGASTVTLRSTDGRKSVFEQDGDVWRLVHVRQQRGWARLTWSDGRLTEVTSDRGAVQLSRTKDGRISAIEDDLGRVVRYSYDSARRLSGVVDLGGGSWRVTYGSDGLSTITDPRGKAVFSVTWADGRVRRVRALHETVDFVYGYRKTMAINLLGWSTVYRHDRSGITTSITDRGSRTTKVAFDDSHRPVAVSRDGVSIARIAYDHQGCIKSLWQPSGETTFASNRHGIATASGAWAAHYRYANGQLVQASDALGERTYRYASDGTLTEAAINGVKTKLKESSDGTLTTVSRSGRALASYAYSPDGRVAAVDYGQGRTASFIYDGRGFRTAAMHTYGQNASIAAKTSDDAAGNLTHRALQGASGAIHQSYRIGDYNEVLRVNTRRDVGRAVPDLVFTYDAAGRVRQTTMGVEYMISAISKLSGFANSVSRTLALLAAAWLACRSGGVMGLDPVAQPWQVEFLGEEEFQNGEYADGTNWEFQATHIPTGAEHIFKSGTESGWFLRVTSHGDIALVDADLGAGARGFTIYDLRKDRKVVEFIVAFPHLSPNGRYMVYRKFTGRGRTTLPDIKIVDLSGNLEHIDVTVATKFDGIGDSLYPPPWPTDRPELAGAYGQTDIGTGHAFHGHPFDQVVWDLESGVLYFVAVDRTGHQNLVVTGLVPAPMVVCTVPLLTAASLRGEYFDRQSAVVRELRLALPPLGDHSGQQESGRVAERPTFEVTLAHGPDVPGVESIHRIDLLTACREQAPGYVSGFREGP